ncbi:MAG: hypothetical protein O2800_04995 [Planctomycetota bacterium]|nr:hypothetical protein [Planctomycetota bacterium]
MTLAALTSSGIVDAWMQVVGRFHPLFVHFPLALIMVAFVAEAWHWLTNRQDVSRFARTCLWIAAAVSVLTASSGWISAGYEDVEDSRTLFLHRWVGISSAVAMVAVVWMCARVGPRFHAHAKQRRTQYRIGLVIASLTVAFTGHLGGELIYGDGYLEEALDKAVRTTFGLQSRQGDAPPSAQEIEAIELGTIRFEDDVQPILTEYCVECHGKKKRNGGLSFTPISEALTLVPEEDEPAVIVAGRPDESDMMRRLTLPSDHDDVMPPDERLSAKDIAILRAWIAQGAITNPSPAIQ